MYYSHLPIEEAAKYAEIKVFHIKYMYINFKTSEKSVLAESHGIRDPP